MKQYDLSFRCYYGAGNHTDHRQTMSLADIRKWIEAYNYTHPKCEAISVKVWLHEPSKKEN